MLQGQRRGARQMGGCQRAKPVQSTYPDHGMELGWPVSHCPIRVLEQNPTKRHSAQKGSRHGQGACREEARNIPAHYHLTLLGVQIRSSQTAYLRLTCSIRSRVMSFIASLGTWKIRVWLQNTIQTLRFLSFSFTRHSEWIGIT